MSSKDALTWLENNLNNFSDRASGEELYRFFNRIVKPIINSEDTSDKDDLVNGLRYWLEKRTESRSMLAVDIIHNHKLTELESEVEALLQDVLNGVAFAPHYEKPIRKALHAIKKE